MRAEKGSLPRVESPGTYWEPGMMDVKDAFCDVQGRFDFDGFDYLIWVRILNPDQRIP